MWLGASKSIRQITFDLFLGLFIFVTFNREMAIGGFELRYLLMALAVVCLLFTVHDSAFENNKLTLSQLEKGLLVYYLFVVASFSVVIWNPSSIALPSFYNLAVLHGFNIVALILVIMNKGFLRLDRVAICVCVSGLVLALSQVAVYVGLDISALMKDSSTRVMAVDLGQGEHINLFGQPFRVSGFAEDPNYACLFNIVTIAMAAFSWRKSRRLSMLVVVASLVGVSLAWSRTVVFGSLACVLIVAVAKLVPRSEKALCTAFVCALVPVALALPFLHIDILQTVTTRYTLWLNAYDLLCQSPLFGNGLTSFRSYNALLQNGWYVHPHSSLWETLSEFGLIAFIALIAVYVFAARRVLRKPVLEFVVLITIVFSINFDCTYLQISVLILAIIPLSLELREHESIMVESLSEGGNAMRRGGLCEGAV